MSYEDIRIAGDLTQTLEAWLARRYGNVVGIEVRGIYEGEYAAVAYAAVASAGPSGLVRAVVLMLKHDPERGADGYRIKDIDEDEGPVVDFCPDRILDLLSPTENPFATHWRDRCRQRLTGTDGVPRFSVC